MSDDFFDIALPLRYSQGRPGEAGDGVSSSTPNNKDGRGFINRRLHKGHTTQGHEPRLVGMWRPGEPGNTVRHCCHSNVSAPAKALIRTCETSFLTCWGRRWGHPCAGQERPSPSAHGRDPRTESAQLGWPGPSVHKQGSRGRADVTERELPVGFLATNSGHLVKLPQTAYLVVTTADSLSLRK